MDRRWVYGGLAVAAGVGLARLITRGPKIEPGKTRLLVIGDSLAVGTSPHFAAIAKEQRVPFEKQAVSGSRIDQWATSKKLGEKLASFKPTMAIVSLGTNDEYLSGDAVKRQSPYLQQLLQRLQDAGVEVAWMGPPTLPKKASNGIVPLLQATIPSSHYFHSETLQIPRGPDKLHPTARGYAGWAGAVWQWLS